MMKSTKLGWIVLLLPGCFFASTATVLAQPADRPGGHEVRVAEPATVTVWNRPIVVLRASIDGVTPRERAERIETRIEELPPEGVVVRSEPVEMGGLAGVAIHVDGRMLFAVLREDLDPESGESGEEVGRQVVARIEEVLRARAEARRPATLVNGLAFTAGALVLLVLFASLVLLLRRRALKRAQRDADREMKVYGVDVHPLASYLSKSSIHILSLALILTSIYLFVAFAFAQFPYSRPWAESLGRFLLDRLSGLTLGALQTVPGLFTVAVLFMAGRLTSRAISRFFDAVARGDVTLAWLEPDTARGTRRLVVVLIWIFFLTAAYPYVPASRTEAFRGISVLVGLMISLGSAGFVNQIMSGLVVIYSRAMRVGDYVRVGDQEGIVSDVGALSTRIVTLAKEEVTLPNAVLIGTSVTNYSKLASKDGAVVRTSLTIGYDVPWRQVHALLERAADRTSGARKTPRPVVLQRSLSDFYVEYQLLVHVERVEERIRVLSELHAQIQDAFNEFGVQIMSPHFESQPTGRVFVPRGQWSQAPAKESAV